MSDKPKMKILLLNPPYRETILRDNYCCHTSKGDYVWPPADMLYVSGNLNAEDTELKVMDAVIDKQSRKAVLEEALDFAPDVIVTLTGTLGLQQDLDLLREIRDNLGNRNFLMGNYPAFNPGDVLEKYDHIDGVFHNFFDPDMLDFVRGVEKDYPSISYRRSDGTAAIGKINYLEPKQSPAPRPPVYSLFNLKKYSTPVIMRKPMATVITAFGCPYTCKFCVASSLNIYHRTIDNLEAELDALAASGCREIFFNDSTFNADPKRVREICRLMIDKGYDFTWSCNIHCLRFALEDFQLMKQAGCHTIQVGVESEVEETRSEFAPTKRKDNLKDVFGTAQQAGIRTLAYFVIGFPHESYEDVQRTIEFAIELDPYFASFTTLMPDFGTKFHEEALESEMISDGYHELDNSGKPLEMNNFKLTIAERKELIRNAYWKFYFRPRQIGKYVKDFRRLPLFIRNGVPIVKRYLLS